MLPRASGFKFFFIFSYTFFTTLSIGNQHFALPRLQKTTQTSQIDFLLPNGIRNPDRSVGEVADRADGVKIARDLHGIRLEIRPSGFCPPRSGDRASL